MHTLRVVFLLDRAIDEETVASIALLCLAISLGPLAHRPSSLGRVCDPPGRRSTECNCDQSCWRVLARIVAVMRRGSWAESWLGWVVRMGCFPSEWKVNNEAVGVLPEVSCAGSLHPMMVESVGSAITHDS